MYTGLPDIEASEARHNESTPWKSIGVVLWSFISSLSGPKVDKQKNVIEIIRSYRFQDTYHQKGSTTFPLRYQ